MEKISIQALNSLFTFLNTESDKILWIRDKNYKRQLYVNEKFEEIWQHPVELLYDNPSVFEQLLVPDDKPRIITELQNRCNGNSPDGVVLMQGLDAKGNVTFLKDRSYLLLNHDGQHVGFMGIGQEVSEAQWRAELSARKAEVSSSEENLRQQIFTLLCKELHLTTANITVKEQSKKQNNTNIKIIHNHHSIELTPREQECLYHLAVGKSAKQTAALLNISTRTVEFHLNNIKLKTDCRTKLQLLSKVVKI